MDIDELLEDGYGCAIFGSFLHGICIGLVKFIGETDTSDMVIAGSKIIALILFTISLIQIIFKNCDSIKEFAVALVKLFLSTGIIYFAISYLLAAIVTFGFIYVILSIILSIVVVIVII